MSHASELTITAVDPLDDAAFAAWHAAYEAAEREGLGEHADVFARDELQVRLQADDRRLWHQAHAGGDSGHLVATGYVATPLADNLATARVMVGVDPARRRRGHGTAMLAHCEQVARDRDRTRLHAEAAWPEAHGPTGTGWPGLEFAIRRGYAPTMGDLQCELASPVDEARLTELAARAEPHHTAYDIRSWVGAVPEELVRGWVALSSRLMVEAPTGEREVEEGRIDVEGFRESEAIVVRQGRTRYHTVALDAAGDVVAYTNLATTVHEPGRAYQWGSLVRPADRGHRLGLAVKVANQRQLQREQPEVTRVTSWVAEANAAMLAVNARLGYRTVARLGELQKEIPRTS